MEYGLVNSFTPCVQHPVDIFGADAIESLIPAEGFSDSTRWVDLDNGIKRHNNLEIRELFEAPNKISLVTTFFNQNSLYLPINLFRNFNNIYNIERVYFHIRRHLICRHFK